MKIPNTNKALFAALLTLTAISQNLYAKDSNRDKPRKPPEEAIQACADKSEGDTATFTTRHGDELTATCTLKDEVLVAIPEGHKAREKKR